MQPIKNVLLDLGGVLLNLSFAKTEAAFAALGLDDFNAHFSQFRYTPIFEALEVGALSKEDFLIAFRAQTGIKAADREIVRAWNAMLLDFPQERMQWLHHLASRYRVFLYSNTNAFHYDEFQQSFALQHPGKTLDQYFEKAFYSHIMGKRKPDAEAFTHLLNLAGITANETLFVDDTPANVEGAIAAGLQGYHLAPGKTVLDINF
jgi:glucose-1-phosphatase